MKRFNLSCFLIALSIVIAIAAVLIWVVRSREIRNRMGDEPAITQPVHGDKPTGPGQGTGSTTTGNQDIDIDNGLRNLAALRGGESPDALMQEMAKALNELNMDEFQRLAGGSIDPRSLESLRDFAARQKQLGRKLELREVGETDLNKGSRWAFEGVGGESALEDEGSRFYLDMRKGEQGWEVEKVTLPGENGVAVNDDALAAAEAFVLAVLSQDFEKARLYVDGHRVSDARIAGLCIIFEEGRYALRKQKPLRLLLKRDEIASYLANVVASDGSETGQFGINLNRQGDPAKWLVSEVNLDRLLADYAERVAGGDVYYSPLVRNPEGGDTLALYFGFDEDEINPRTRRQLEIVAAILKADPVKKLTLSGHTDSKGTDDYNKSLSMRRAEAVKDFLLAAGVQAPQVVTLAKGDSEPRRPNVTETGEDNPEGRRANRRTEIYLDF